MKNYDVLDELVPKTQELHRAIFDKGYEQGFKDGLNSEYKHDHDVLKAYGDGQDYILDELSTELKANKEKWWWLFPTGDCFMKLSDVLEIINKYKSESEVRQ